MPAFTSDEAAAAPGPGGIPVVTILLLYSPAAVEARLGWDEAQGYAKTCVATLNSLVFPTSDIACRMKLVDVAELDMRYKEAKTYQEMLNELTEGKLTVGRSGRLKRNIGISVARHRDNVKADLVSLFVVCAEKGGLAWPMKKRDRDFARLAFSVVNCDEADEQFDFAHEIGHNFGCCHERGRHQGASLTEYGFAHEFRVNRTWHRTIMWEVGPRKWFFSNPNRKYLGVATGVPLENENAAYNAKVMTDSAPIVAGFR